MSKSMVNAVVAVVVGTIIFRVLEEKTPLKSLLN